MHKSWKVGHTAKPKSGAGVHCHGCQATPPDDKKNEKNEKMKWRISQAKRLKTRSFEECFVIPFFLVPFLCSSSIVLRENAILVFHLRA